MKLRDHLTSIALVLAAAGAGVYAFCDRGSVTAGEKKARTGSLFSAWRREDVTRIELLRGGDALVLGRTLGADSGDNAWHMISPRKDEADAASVDRLLQQLELANVIRSVEPGGGWGLTSPRLQGTLTMGELRFRFALGDAAPTPEGAAYLLVQEGTDAAHVYVVSRDLVGELLKGADAYRARTIVPYLSIDLAKMEVRGPGGGFGIERVDATSFRLQEGGLRASRDRLDRVWRALAEMRAETFLSEADAKKATLARAFVITMTPKDASRATGEIVVGLPCPGHPEGVVVMRTAPAPLAACAPKGILEGLATTSESLVDRRLFAAHEDEIAELRLDASPGGVSIDLARKGTGWHERAPRDRDLTSDETDAANALVTVLAHAEGDVVQGGDPIRARAIVRSRVTALGEASSGLREEGLEVLAIEKETFVRRLVDGATLRVSSAIARKLSPRATALRGRQVWSSPVDGKPVRSITTRCRGVTEDVDRDGNAWNLRISAPAPAPGAHFDVDVPKVLELSEALARVKADAWVADADDGTFGLGADACRAALTIAEEAGPRTVGLVLGDEGEGGVYARVEGDAAVFVLPPLLRELAGTLLVDLHGFSSDVAAVRRVTLARRAQKPVVLETGLPEPVATALAELRADAVVHLGGALPGEGFGTPTLEITVERRADAGAATTRIVLGGATTARGKNMYFARISGVDATFLVARERVASLVDGLHADRSSDTDR